MALVEILPCWAANDAYIRAIQGANMADVVVVYWRDIPAQVIVGKGRSASKVQLPERFEQAIDRCAMKIGAKDADAYLAEWRKAPAYEVVGESDEVARAEAARLDAAYDTDRIKVLIANDGWDAPQS
jgi:hypothetical protein